MPTMEEAINGILGIDQKVQNDAAAKNKSEWDKMLSQARMAMAMDGQTALGLALGKLLKDGWNSYKKSQYDKKKGEALGNNPYTPYGSSAQTTQAVTQTPEGVVSQESSYQYNPWNDIVKGAIANGAANREQAMQNASSPEAIGQQIQQGLNLTPEELNTALNYGKQFGQVGLDILQRLPFLRR